MRFGGLMLAVALAAELADGYYSEAHNANHAAFVRTLVPLVPFFILDSPCELVRVFRKRFAPA